MSLLKHARQRAAELRAEVALVGKQISAISTPAIAAKRGMTDVERADFLALTARRERLADEQTENDAALRAAEDANERERAGEAIDDPDQRAAQQAAARAGVRASGQYTGDTSNSRPRGPISFGSLFPKLAGDTAGFESAEEFFRTLHSGRADARLRQAGMRAASGTESTPSDGGFLVPPQFFSNLFNQSLEDSIVLPAADVRPMTGSEALSPAWDDVDHSSNIYGGFTASWIGEAGAPAAQMGKLRLIHLKARKLALFAAVSNELVADGLNFEQMLGTAISSALGFFLDQAFFNGDGSNKPQGIFSAPATIAVARTTPNRVLYEDIVALYARLLPQSFGTAKWVVSQSTLPDLLTLSMAIGTAGAAIPLVKESDGEYSMLGLEIEITEKVPALGTTGDVGLYDFQNYVVGLRSEFALEKSMHVGFASDQTYYRGIIRVDGQPKMSKPITPASGGATVSPFIVLAA